MATVSDELVERPRSEGGVMMTKHEIIERMLDNDARNLGHAECLGCHNTSMRVTADCGVRMLDVWDHGTEQQIERAKLQLRRASALGAGYRALFPTGGA